MTETQRIFYGPRWVLWAAVGFFALQVLSHFEYEGEFWGYLKFWVDVLWPLGVALAAGLGIQIIDRRWFLSEVEGKLKDVEHTVMEKLADTQTLIEGRKDSTARVPLIKAFEPTLSEKLKLQNESYHETSKHFRVDEYNLRSDFQKLAYLAGFIGVSHAEIAEIADETPAVVDAFLAGERKATIEDKELFEKLNLIRALFSSLLRLGQFSGEQVVHLLSETEEFKECVTPPPWYPLSLRAYLTKGKTKRHSKPWFGSKPTNPYRPFTSKLIE